MKSITILESLVKPFGSKGEKVVFVDREPIYFFSSSVCGFIMSGRVVFIGDYQIKRQGNELQKKIYN
jgi:hypothetical protein